MGDRITVVAWDSKTGEIGPAGVYAHFRGGEAPEILKGAESTFRHGDPGYVTARVVIAFAGRLPVSPQYPAAAALSLGIIPPPADLESETLAEYSPGDAGVALLDVATGRVTYHAGYFRKNKVTRLALAKV